MIAGRSWSKSTISRISYTIVALGVAKPRRLLVPWRAGTLAPQARFPNTSFRQVNGSSFRGFRQINHVVVESVSANRQSVSRLLMRRCQFPDCDETSALSTVCPLCFANTLYFPISSVSTSYATWPERCSAYTNVTCWSKWVYSH
jgi:hypothetical protein